MSVMNSVRNAISKAHFEIEQTPFSQGMLNGSLKSFDYSRGLVQLWHVHHALEEAVLHCDLVSMFFTPDMVRTNTIERDLKSFGFQTNSFPILPETENIVQDLQGWASTSSVALLGCIYILEGSRMGSLVIAKPLSHSLGLVTDSTAGIEYHTEGAATTPMRLKRLKEQVDHAGLGTAAEAVLVRGAVQFMEKLNLLYAALPVRPLSQSA